jgi:hypothetical protein
MVKLTLTVPACIEPGRFYQREVFKGISGMGDTAIRTAKRNGFKVHTIGGREFIAADDFIAYAESQESGDAT